MSRARRHGADSLIACHLTLNRAFLALVLVMAAHQAEHLAQVLQKDVLGNACPQNCRGALGSIFDIEWVHFAYNASILVALVVLFAGYGMQRREWRLAAPGAWTLLAFGIAVQSYHVVEHVAKLDQWLDNGHRAPTPGLLGMPLAAADGRNFSLVELHFVFNSVVFVAVVAAYVGFRVHRHTAPARPRLRLAAAAAFPLLLLGPAAAAYAMQPPLVRLPAGEHTGPLVLDRAQRLVGEPGTVVRGGIVITADDVDVRGVTVVGGRNGIEVRDAERVRLVGVRVSGFREDGIHARQSSVSVRDCVVRAPRGSRTHGIDISFGMHVGDSRVEGCHVSGGESGIELHLAHADVRHNDVSGTSVRGITMSEMSMGAVEWNTVSGGLGVGIYCGDWSVCEIRRNVVRGTRAAPGGASRAGYGIQAYYYATAELSRNTLVANNRRVGAYLHAELRQAER